MPGAAFGLPLHSFRFQKIKKFAFLKKISSHANKIAEKTGVFSGESTENTVTTGI